MELQWYQHIRLYLILSCCNYFLAEVALQQALESLVVANLGMNLILPLFTTSGVFILGAYFKLQSFLFMPLYGMNNAIVPIISFNMAPGKRAGSPAPSGSP